MDLLRQAIRLSVRKILEKEVLSEVNASKHFADRAYDRLESSVWTIPPFNDPYVKTKIALLEKMNFSELESFAIKLGKYRQVYRAKNPENEKISEGDELWVVIRNNQFGSIFFRLSTQKTPIQNIEYFTDFKELESYFLAAPKTDSGSVNVSIKALKSFKNKALEKDRVQTYKLDFPTVELGGKVWYIDEKNDILINAKNWNKKIPIGDLEEKDLEKVIEYI